jgi:hypothetical protein
MRHQRCASAPARARTADPEASLAGRRFALLRAGMAPRLYHPTPEEAEAILQRTLDARRRFPLREFARRIDGMCHAMDGGLWLHFHLWYERPLAHLVSTDRRLLLDYGEYVGIPASRLQDKPLRDPRTRERRPAWHWDLGGPWLPPRLGG